MDKRVRKYMLYKARNLKHSRNELQELYKLKSDIINSTTSGGFSAGKSKGFVGNPTEQKALRVLEIDKRIDRLEEEIQVFDKFEKEVAGLDRQIYFETIKAECFNLQAKADLFNIGRRQLIEKRAKILRYLAKELGEYLGKE